MDYTYLGRSGIKVSRICLGTMTYGNPNWREWILGEQSARPLLRQACEAGINFFDTADMYSKGESERLVGRVLKDLAPRDKLVIATKTFFPMSDDVNDWGLSRKHILTAVNNSLRRLGTDYIDLYYIHRWHYGTPIEETLHALNMLIEQGKVRYIGASSMFAWQFTKALYLADRHGWQRFIAMQNHYNLMYREEEREMNPLCNEEGVAIVPWSPIARGYLAGGRFEDEEQPTKRAQSDEFARKIYTETNDREIVARLHVVAGRLGHSPSQVALAWLLHKPGVAAPVIGSRKKSHFREAVGALDIKLTDEDIISLEEPYQPHPIKGHPPYGTEAVD